MVSRNTMHKLGSALTFVAGIGPEISQSIKDIYTAAGVRDNELNLFIYSRLDQVPIQWEEVSVTPVLKGGKTVIPETAIQSVRKNTVALKGWSLVTFTKWLTII